MSWSLRLETWQCRACGEFHTIAAPMVNCPTCGAHRMWEKTMGGPYMAGWREAGFSSQEAFKAAQAIRNLAEAIRRATPDSSS